MLIESEGELCVCELTEALTESQPKVSRHLAQLRQCELLLDRKQGQWVYYRINPALPAWTKVVLEQTSKANTVFIKENLANLSRMGDRPNRAASCC
jgi:ArsR family transcriptional regulator